MALGTVLAANPLAIRHSSVTLLHNPACFQVKAGGGGGVSAALPAPEHKLEREWVLPMKTLKTTHHNRGKRGAEAQFRD